MLRLAAQIWEQSPVIFLMVAGLVLFGTYALMQPVREQVMGQAVADGEAD
jgi:hypothetical protein